VSCKPKTVLFAGLAVLFASVSNAHAHIHLCFDGQQPPVTIHGAQDADHAHYGHEHHSNEHESDEQNCHGDLDLDLDADGLAKSFKPDLSAILSPNPCVVAISALAIAAPITSEGNASGTDPPHTRPPSRAPPTILL
jgi:hypothetical protein